MGWWCKLRSSEKTHRSHGRRPRVVGRLAEHVGARKPEVGTEEVNDDCAYTWKEEPVWLRFAQPARLRQPICEAGLVAALAGSLALAPGACWWSVSRRPEASVCLLVVIGSGAARVCKLELILANDVAVDLQEVGRGR